MKNDVRKRLLLGWAAILCVNCAFMACSDDDDESNSLSSSARPGTIKVGNDRYRIESVGGIEFEYSEDGELVAINGNEVSNNPFKIVELEGEDDETIFSNFSFNGSGYITKYTVTNRYFYSENDKGEEKENISVSYNKQGQVTKISVSYNGVEYYDGDKFEEKGTETFTYTYKDGKLVQISDAGGDTDEAWSCIYEYEYDNIDNIFGQFTHGLTYCLSELSFGEEFAYLGLFGVPSKELPVRLNYSEKGSYKDEDGNHEYDSEDSYDISYSFDENGLIEYEIINGSRYGYSYIMDGTANHKVIEKTEASKPLKEKARGFRRGHRRHQ